MAAQTARRSHAELERAARLAAVLDERERLSRQVHDGVMQVLALVACRGREIGCATAELAELAGEQERALRRPLLKALAHVMHTGDYKTVLANWGAENGAIDKPVINGAVS